jgi:hypothetical protein
MWLVDGYIAVAIAVKRKHSVVPNVTKRSICVTHPAYAMDLLVARKLNNIFRVTTIE